MGTRDPAERQFSLPGGTRRRCRAAGPSRGGLRRRLAAGLDPLDAMAADDNDDLFAAAITAVLLVLAVGALLVNAWRAEPPAVILEATALRAGPAMAAQRLRDMEPGAGVVAVERTVEWVRVRTLDGREGWVESDGLAELVAR